MERTKMAKKKLTNYDPAEDLGSDQAIATFIAEALQTNDLRYTSHAVGVVARAKRMTEITSRQSAELQCGAGMRRQTYWRGKPFISGCVASTRVMPVPRSN